MTVDDVIKQLPHEIPIRYSTKEEKNGQIKAWVIIFKFLNEEKVKHDNG
jgi:hypothetical protein